MSITCKPDWIVVVILGSYNAGANIISVDGLEEGRKKGRKGKATKGPKNYDGEEKSKSHIYIQNPLLLHLTLP